MSSKKRITIFKNGENSGGKVMLIPKTLPELLSAASSLLRMDCQHIFLASGGEVTDVDLISADDTLYATEDEQFIAPADPSSSSASSSSSTKDSLATFHVAVLGPGAVGKSAVTLRFVRNTFVKTYDPTIEEFYRTITSVDGVPACLDLLDTAGQDDFVTLRSTWMRGRDGFFLLYAINDQHSFEELEQFMTSLQQTYIDTKRPPVVLLGNKCDLKEERKISTAQGQAYAQSIQADFLEVSAKTGEGIQEAFQRLVREMRKRMPTKAAPKKRFCSIL